MIAIISSIISAVSSIATTVGPALSTFATTLVAKLPSIIETIVKVAKVVVDVAQTFGLLNPDEDALTLGAKVKQEGTRGRMDGESMEDYFNYLREEVELDKEKLDNMTDEEKVACQVVGTAMTSEAISEKMGVKLSPEFVASMAKMEMSAVQLEAYVKSFCKNGIDSMDYLIRFLNGKLSDSDLVQVYNIVESVEKVIDPTLDENALQSKIEDMKSAIQPD